MSGTGCGIASAEETGGRVTLTSLPPPSCCSRSMEESSADSCCCEAPCIVGVPFEAIGTDAVAAAVAALPVASPPMDFFLPDLERERDDDPPDTPPPPVPS